MYEILSLPSSLASTYILVGLLAGSYLFYRKVAISSNDKAGKQAKRPSSRISTSASPRSSAEACQSVVSKESEFPDNWWNGKDVFELERRAIFSKTWLYVSHRSRFTKPGDYHSLDIAGFPVFLILGKDGIVRAFHNVCRHRAYTITKKECGSSTVLGCRYHGWSYNTRGDLIKAPHFEDVPGFDKSQNGLFEIHAHTSNYGLIFINLDASPSVPEVDSSQSNDFAASHGLTVDSTWVTGWTLEGAFNWKMAVKPGSFDLGNLQGCSPRSKLSGLTSLFIRTSPAGNTAKLGIFPSASLYSIQGSGLLYSLCFLPYSERKTLIRCDLYGRNQQPSSAATVSKELSRVLRDRVTEIEKGYLAEIAEIRRSKPPSMTESQYAILLHLKTHLKLEKTLGHEVFPTLRRSTRSSKSLQADLLCKELDCKDKLSFDTKASTTPKRNEILVW
ncbi:iron-sulfur cluster-binding protein [Paecilomyces variotii]|uniref:Iron-sulfur cluster-binding protein n=1 Tax=Byssochlamys spectabilis TaxID=264951 RepID=A0A443HQP2_BYSSP|nr:iron-sulfur cluster-binding protein [Paecilomyces variotii]RWQ94094.1 iron-sulfur cluster-binding protein [Paecilomyces variotii]